MAYWNSGAVFNRRGNQNGFTWNSKHFLFVVRLNDTMRAVDGLPLVLARLALQDRSMRFYDALLNAAVYQEIDSFALKEEHPFVTLLVKLMEDAGMKDEFTDYVVNLFLREEWRTLDSIKIVASLLTDDAFGLDEKTKLDALYYLVDRYNLKEIDMTYFTELFLSDRFSMTDHDLKQAISQLLIGAVGSADRSFDYFEPMFVQMDGQEHGMRVDWRQTEIVPMPEASHTTISIPGVDGDLIQNTVYRDRLFKIVAYSEDNLTIQQRENLKRRITEVLDSTKKESKHLTVQARSIMFDAKYNNSTITDGPSYVKMETEFRVGPYGMDLFPQELHGSGLVSNLEGAAPLRVVHKITGSVSNPSFTLGSIVYRYNGTVPVGKTLVINHDTMSCYLVNDFGVKENALKNLTGDFQAIPAGDSAALVASSNTASRIVTEWSTPLLW